MNNKRGGLGDRLVNEDSNPGQGLMWRQVSEDNERDKPRDLFDPSEKAAKLIRMLGNGASDTEIVGAARALDRTLEGVGGLHHLADIVEANWHPPIQIKQPQPQPEPKHDWQILAARLLRTHASVLIRSDRIDEVDFLTNMRKSRSCPTDKQWKWMGDIEARLPPEQRSAA
jgi:hypothetical protein